MLEFLISCICARTLGSDANGLPLVGGFMETQFLTFSQDPFLSFAVVVVDNDASAELFFHHRTWTGCFFAKLQSLQE